MSVPEKQSVVRLRLLSVSNMAYMQEVRKDGVDDEGWRARQTVLETEQVQCLEQGRDGRNCDEAVSDEGLKR